MEEKWDLTYIFKNDEEWQKNYEKGLLLVDEVKKYKIKDIKMVNNRGILLIME